MDAKIIEKLFNDHGFIITPQALCVIDKLANPEEFCKQMIEQIKKEKINIGGADVIRFLTAGKVGAEEEKKC